MLRSFSEVEKWILDEKSNIVIALACCHDRDTLESVSYAHKKGVISGAILIGKTDIAKEVLLDLGETLDNYTFIEEQDDLKSAQLAIELVRTKKATLPMKGLMPTAVFLKAVLDKEKGLLDKGKIISQATVYESKREKRFMIITDCSINIAPDYEAKKKIIENGVILAHNLGIECPKVAVVTPLETINTAMQSTIDAAMLSKAAERGQITGCIVDGPLGLDNAVSKEAAEHKKIVSKVAGQPDILLMPDICAGNIFTKALIHFGDGSPSAGTVTGVNSGIIMTSRSDTIEDKYYAILIAILQAKKAEKR